MTCDEMTGKKRLADRLCPSFSRAIRPDRLMASLLSFLCLTGPGALWGCDCGPVPICLRVGNATVIFIGTLLSTRAIDGEQAKQTARLTVEEPFKGLKPEIKDVEVVVEQQADCDLVLVKGQRYLVFARASKEGFVASRDCPVPLSMRQAAPDVLWIRDWAQGNTPSLVMGQIKIAGSALFQHNLEEQPLSDAQVIASGDSGVYKAVTDLEGHFTLQVLPGKYGLQATRIGYESLEPSYTVNVPRGGCSRLQIPMWSSSTISGTILNSVGLPLRGVKAELVLFENGEMQLANEAISDEQGRYELTRVPAGDYLLGINLLAGINSRLPYAVRYFPGVSSRELAAVLRIDEGQSLNHYDFSLEDPQGTRTIRVKVRWPDGRPVINASVNFRSEAAKDSLYKMDWQNRFTDEKGEARCEVLSNKEFTVDADRLFWVISSSPIQGCQLARVPPGENPVDLELVLPIQNDLSSEDTPKSMARFNE